MRATSFAEELAETKTTLAVLAKEFFTLNAEFQATKTIHAARITNLEAENDCLKRKVDEMEKADAAYSAYVAEQLKEMNEKIDDIKETDEEIEDRLFEIEHPRPSSSSKRQKTSHKFCP
jgi:DNA helicase IV